MNFDDYEILKKLRKEFRNKVETAYVFGKNGDNALLCTTDDRVYAIGENTCGWLGLGSCLPHGLPTEMKLSRKGMKGLVFGGDDVEREFLVAFLDSGEIFWWGVIPFPVNEVVFAPEKISINAKIRVKAVACGASHCAVLSEDGEVFTCGRNYVGQLGHAAIWTQEEQTMVLDTECNEWIKQEHFGASELSRVKGMIEDQFVTDIACGYDFNVVLLDDGRVAAWGNNHHGQLGTNARGGFVGAPVEVVSFSSYYETVIKKIVCGKYHALALSETGTLYEWGYSSQGLMGVPGVSNREMGCPLEVEVDGIRFADIGASYLCTVSVAECENGKVYLWGKTDKDGCIPKPIEAEGCKSINDVFVSVVKPKIKVHSMSRRENPQKIFSKVEAAEEMPLLETLKNQFNDPDFSDLTIVVEKKKIYVHQCILKMRSHYFNVLITRWLEKNDSVLIIKEKSFAAIEAYLKYLYTDEVEADLYFAIELYQLADEYGDRKFKSICQNIIMRDMKSDEVADIFADTRKMADCQILNKFSLEFSLRHAREVIHSPGFESWDLDTMKDFVRQYVKIKGNCRHNIRIHRRDLKASFSKALLPLEPKPIKRSLFTSLIFWTFRFISLVLSTFLLS